MRDIIWFGKGKQPNNQDDISLLFHLYVYLGQVEQSVSEV
jgi:hypothetical protein